MAYQTVVSLMLLGLALTALASTDANKAQHDDTHLQRDPSAKVQRSAAIRGYGSTKAPNYYYYGMEATTTSSPHFGSAAKNRERVKQPILTNNRSPINRPPIAMDPIDEMHLTRIERIRYGKRPPSERRPLSNQVPEAVPSHDEYLRRQYNVPTTRPVITVSQRTDEGHVDISLHYNHRNRGACRYKKEAWSDCDVTTKQQTRRLILKKGGSECQSFKEETKTCVAKIRPCRYEKGNWSECNEEGNRVRVDTLKTRASSSPNPNCQPTKTTSKKCKSAASGCNYERNAQWSACENGSMTKIITLVGEATRKCPATKTLRKSCNPHAGKHKSHHEE